MIDALAQFFVLEPASRLLFLLTISTIVFAVLAAVFVAAALLLRWRNSRKAERWGSLEAAWEADLLDFLSGDMTAEAMRARVARGDQLYFIGYLARFASRLRGSERELIGTVAAPYLPGVARQLTARLPGVRARAVRTLSLLGLREYSYGIINALDDESPLVAMTAARALSRREQPEFASAVLVKLRRFTDWSPRYLSAMLAGIGPAAAPYLRGTFADQREPSAVRVVAADALRTLNDLESAASAATIVRESTDVELVAASLKLLRTCGNADHAGVVREKLVDGNSVVRSQAAAALGVLGDKGDVHRLRYALGDESIWVAWHAARALLAIGGHAALESIGTSNHARAELVREILAEPT